MLNKSHSLSRYEANNGKKNVWYILTLMLWSLSIAFDTRYKFLAKFLQ